MTTDDPGDPPEPPPTDFDWESPRWRAPEEPADEDERSRRFRGARAPLQRGAIDAADSVPSGPGDAERTTPETAD